MSRWVMLVVVVVAACDSKKQEPSPAEGKPPEAALPIAFGDCAAPTVAFVSGPRPLPFTAADADQTWTAKADPPTPPASAQDDPPPPEEPDDDDDGGTGTAIALEEGKMGKKDSDRAQGQYKMKRNQDDPQLARQQAIEQARAAGIIGSTALRQGGAFVTLTGSDSSGFDDGGFGYGRPGSGHTGFGPGGGATGWGTIGSGRYGNIGIGSKYGIGTGPGGMRDRLSAVPTVSLGSPNAVGDLDKAIIRRFVKRNLMKMTYCYEKELLAKPGLSGTVATSFFIAPTGSVKTATATGVDPQVASCIADVIRGIEFPKPKGGGGVQVNYPITFRPPENSVAGAGSGSAGSAAEVAPPAVPRPLFRSSEQGAVEATAYVPGKSNPLRAEQAALATCLGKSPARAGVAVVELSYAGAGTVEKAVVHGIADEATRACVVELAKRVKRAGSAAAERCSFAFGEVPASELPALEIAGTRAKLVGGTVKLDADVSAQAAEIVAAIEARVKAASAPDLPVVTTHGPLVVRAPAATEMLIVDRAIASVLAGGDDFVLAVQNDKSWSLLAPMALPVVPVPYGTGGRWNHASAAGVRDTAPDEDRAVVSVLVGAEHVYVGTSRGDVKRIPSAEVAKLGSILKAHESKRTELEIAGDGAATYGAFAQAVQQAIAAGFTDWQHVRPKSLTVKVTE